MATEPSYWVALFTYQTWNEFLASGGNTCGFRPRAKATAQKIRVGDRILCYLTGVSRFIGLYEATSVSYMDSSPIWKEDLFPVRLAVQSLVSLTADTAVPITSLRERLSIFRNMKAPGAWAAYLKSSPAKFTDADGKIVELALLSAQVDPQRRPINIVQLEQRPIAVLEDDGTMVSMPREDEEPEVVVDSKATEHTEIQWRLLKLGSDLGYNVFAPGGDKNRHYDGKKLASVRNFCDSLPIRFSAAAQNIIANIDVIWLDDDAIVAAFEIESTTQIYSGLLRMSDLVSQQPNMDIPLYIVAPDERRNKVVGEINRPTFAKLKKPLVSICKYISFTTLRDACHYIEERALARHLKVSYLDEVAETCEPAIA